MKVAHAPLHKALKSAWHICYALGHSVELPEAQWSYKRGLGFVNFCHFNLVIPGLEVENVEPA